MRVHFSASLNKINEHIATYEFIERTIQDNGHSIARKWLQEYKAHKAASPRFSSKEWEEISDDTLAAVQEADAVIIEASAPSFNMGYLSAMALARKKPLLMLFNKQPQAAILDANNSLRRAAIYHSPDELKDIITSFLKDVDFDDTKLRFNMALDRETYNFLNWESVNTGKTKAQIVREILKEHIHEKP